MMLLSPVTFSENEEEYEKMTSFKESLYVLFNKKEVAGEYHTGIFTMQTTATEYLPHFLTQPKSKILLKRPIPIS